MPQALGCKPCLRTVIFTAGGAAYWFRRRVPTDLIPVLGRKEWKESLATKDLEAAKKKVRARASETDREIEAARARAKIAPSPPLTQAEARALADEQLAWWLNNDEEARRISGRRAYEAAERALEEFGPEHREAFAMGAWTEERQTTEETLARAGRHYAPNDPSFRLLAQELLRARVEAVKGIERRQLGEIVEPPVVAVAPSGPQSMTLGALIDAYEAEREKLHGEASTARKYRHVFAALKEALGRDRPIRDITRSDCRAVRDMLARMPAHLGKKYPGLTIAEATEAGQKVGAPVISPGTLGTYLNNLSAVFNFAVKEEWLAKNPAQGLGGKGPPTVKRRGFTPEELEKAFAALVEEGTERPSRYWLPALSLYSGARAGELAQLRVGDIKQVGGVWCMDLSEFDEDGRRAADKRLKTAASERVVPLHPALMKAGFKAFVESRGDASERLFPDLREGPNGGFTHEFSKWWGRFLDRIGLKQPSLTFHSFRHGFRDAGRAAGIPTETVEALGGWASSGQAAGYGDRAAVPLLARASKKISYGKFQLPPL